MNTQKAFFTLGLLLAFVIILPSARADEKDQATKLTFNQPVQIPGRVLPAGTYWFVLAENAANRNIVRIFNSDKSTLYATIFAINTESLTATDKTAITFTEGEPMQPATILSWYYPGHSSGHQFVYSPTEEQELAQVKHHTEMVSGQNNHQTAVAGD
jgi:hypothetical protein